MYSHRESTCKLRLVRHIRSVPKEKFLVPQTTYQDLGFLQKQGQTELNKDFGQLPTRPNGNKIF